MTHLRDYSLCNVLVIAAAPEPTAPVAPLGASHSFPVDVLADAGFRVMRAGGVVEGIGHLRSSQAAGARIGVVFVDPSLFPGIDRDRIACMLQVIDACVEVAFVSDGSEADSDE